MFSSLSLFRNYVFFRNNQSVSSLTMDRTGKFIYSHTFLNVELSNPIYHLGPRKMINGLDCCISCYKQNESEWVCYLNVWPKPSLSLGWKIDYKIKTKNGFETVGTIDERIEDKSGISFREDPKYFVNGKMTIECHVEVYEIDKNGIRKPQTVTENERGIGLHNQKSQLTNEEKELQTAISLSKKEFEQQKSKERQKAKEEQKAKEQKKKKETLSCTICLLEYGEEGDRTPRVLDCGHTLCLGCCKSIARLAQIQCPFCRVVTQLTGRTVSNLPKNYLALSM
ncbi:hypothetical protein CRE_26721 [Caenorhabditis remanei]|uniref:RING-type domain-containing protein n=1 Tax=Caenorhabditis remanei TaxID=31234 RepID=E3MXV3_CAERE|nr:hypothetical protein CRE_26721 [Caenorhabditis remanei]